MAAKGTSRPKLTGLKKNAGQLGLIPFDEGDYLVEVTEASDDKRTSNGDYMLKLRMNILAAPEQEDGRDPTGMSTFTQFPIPSPEASWYDIALTRYKNALDAFGIRVPPDESAVAPEKFVGKRAVIHLTVKLDDKTEQLRQDNRGFTAVDDSQYAGEV